MRLWHLSAQSQWVVDAQRPYDSPVMIVRLHKSSSKDSLPREVACFQKVFSDCKDIGSERSVEMVAVCLLSTFSAEKRRWWRMHLIVDRVVQEVSVESVLPFSVYLELCASLRNFWKSWSQPKMLRLQIMRSLRNGCRRCCFGFDRILAISSIALLISKSEEMGDYHFDESPDFD